MARITTRRFTIHRLIIRAEIQQAMLEVTRHKPVRMAGPMVPMVEATAILRVEAQAVGVRQGHQRRLWLHRAVDGDRLEILVAVVESDRLTQAVRRHKEPSRP